MKTIPQTMQSIRQSVETACADLAGAQNAVHVLMGGAPLEINTDHIGNTLPEMLAAVQAEMLATDLAFAELAAYVHNWTTGTVSQQQAETPRQVEKVEPIPQPIVAPTLASSTTSSAITAADMAESVERLTETEESATIPTDDTPEDRPEPDADEETAATHTNRIASHLSNGHVPHGDELATVLDSPEVESTPSGKRGGKRRRSK